MLLFGSCHDFDRSRSMGAVEVQLRGQDALHTVSSRQLRERRLAGFLCGLPETECDGSVE